MDIFFHNRKRLRFPLCKDSLGQRSHIDLCIVSADLFQSVLDISVKTCAVASTDYHVVVYNFRLENPIRFI